jgi:hypothetical protein
MIDQARCIDMLPICRAWCCRVTWKNGEVVDFTPDRTCKLLGRDCRCTIYENRPKECREWGCGVYTPEEHRERYKGVVNAVSRTFNGT